ncbi:MAG: ABC transporter ATP-binding protein [Erysipelotrichaceae bacterium]|nr:ABC transporter ATP-binding protein [Erysipelotrichaceae bacterium]
MKERLIVNNVSIKYLTGDLKNMGMKDYFIKKIKGEFIVKEFWADRNITFSLNDGDMLGIIGTNGAGKSTMLKAISGILTPSEGYIRKRGSIAALLELHSGFDIELTVKENTYLRGAMLGYSRAFMNEKYDEIIRYAELENFQDSALHQLSSGMRSRLAFSIACQIKPDILILDEVLSVGDGAFRKKSEERMKEIINGGATTILVSHSINQIRRMCNKILWLNKGDQIAFGDDVDKICYAYNYFLEHKKLPESDEEMSMMAEIQQEIENEELIKEQDEMIQKAEEIKANRAAEAERREAEEAALDDES